MATAIKAFYNVFLHPLSGYPGPKLWAATDAPYTIRWVNGTLSSQITQLHKIYGDIVRVGPSRLSYAHPDAWNDIRGHRKAGTDENPKDPHFYSVSSKQNILGSPRDDHARFRRVLSHGFSAKVMQQQQPIINTYIDLLIRRFKEIASAAQESGVPAVADVVAYFNYTTFDVIGDLAFGEPFGCLEKQKLHPWVQVIFDSNIEFGIAVMILRHAPIVLKLAKALAPERMGKALAGQVAFARRKVDQRLSLQTSRPDYIDAMLAGEGDPSKAITHTEMVQNSRILVLAGSETTATALSATTFFLATHLDVQQRLAKEVRSSFKTEEEIDVYSVQKLEYMLAVLDESMRMFPPVPSPLPRVCQKGGDVICGRYVPGGVSSKLRGTLPACQAYKGCRLGWISGRWRCSDPLETLQSPTSSFQIAGSPAAPDSTSSPVIDSKLSSPSQLALATASAESRLLA